MVSFLISAVLLLAGCRGVAIRLGWTWAERYWIFLAALAFQLGALVLICSALGQLQPTTWLLVQASLLAVLRVFQRRSRRHEETPEIAVPELPATWMTWALGIGLVAAVVLSSLLQGVKPINDVDGRGYHASRCLYWIQNRSIFLNETHNDRQTDFPFGAELFFLWPVVFTHLEVVGRLVFWLGFPLSVLGVFSVLRQLATGRNAALAGALLYAVTPTVLSHSLTMKPEMWSALFTLGVAFWVVRLFGAATLRPGPAFWVGVFLALSMSVRFTILALVPPCVLLVGLLVPGPRRLRDLGQMGLGGALGLTASGAFFVLLHNTAVHDHPLGGSGMRELVRADPSRQQLYVHAVRTAFSLVELPALPSQSIRETLTDMGNRLLNRLHADVQLRWEDNPCWPGQFTVGVPPYATRYSLTGLLWMAALIGGSGLLAVDLVGSFPRVHVRPISALAMLAIPLFVAVIFTIRWMGGVERFWITPFALGLPLAVALFTPLVAHRRFAKLAVLGVLTLLVYYPLKEHWGEVRHFHYVRPAKQDWLDEPYPEVRAYLPPGSRILLVSGQGFLDYPLFDPADGYPNQVVSWGQRPWDPERMKRLFVEKQITHVLVEHDQAVVFIDHPPLLTGPMVQWLAQQPELHEDTLPTRTMRLFEVRSWPQN